MRSRLDVFALDVFALDVFALDVFALDVVLLDVVPIDVVPIDVFVRGLSSALRALNHLGAVLLGSRSRSTATNTVIGALW